MTSTLKHTFADPSPRLSPVRRRPAGSVARLALSTGVAAAVAVAASAQPAPARPDGAAPPPNATAAALPGGSAPRPLGYATVAQALAALEARDGESTVVTHPDGWVVVNEPAAAAQWSFTPKGYYAHPAVVRRIIRRGPDRAATVETASLCEAPADACAKLLQEFASLNERITQATRARQGVAPPGAPR